MDKFLETYNFLKLSEEEAKSLKRPITATEIDSINKKCPTNKFPEPCGSIDELYQTFKEELIPILLKLF